MGWTYVWPTLREAIDSAQKERPKWKARWAESGLAISRAKTRRGFVRGHHDVVARVLRDGTVRYGR